MILASLGPRERELVEFAQRLVATPSLPGRERAVSVLVAAKLRELGYREVSIDEHGNVVGTFGAGSPALMFNGHLDHVPPAGMDDPYGAQFVHGSRWSEAGVALRGRGSCDMKANVAAGAFAPAFLTWGRLRRAYLFTADVREEVDGPEGIESLLARGLRADHGLSGEATGLDVALGHRGKLQLDVVVSGRSSHAGAPERGENAVYGAVPFLAALERHQAVLRADPLFGPATVTVTGIRSSPGGDVAVVPNACTIRVDRRYLPGETPEASRAELEALVARVVAAHGTPAEVRPVNVYPLMRTAADHPLVAVAAEAVRSVTGREPGLIAWRFGVNATFMSAAGIPSIGIGPGDEQYAHTAEEHVPVAELAQASRIYATLIAKLCT
jgi:putative selenium metabolism hydrolase